MPAHPVGHIKPNPPIKGHALLLEGRPIFCQHGKKIDPYNQGTTCCRRLRRDDWRGKCECGATFPGGSAYAARKAHREHKAELRGSAP